MKAIDFTQPGGFPLTQDQLDYLQQAYTESTSALSAMGGDSTTPFIVSGISVTNPVLGEYAITEGWFFYNNEMVRCAAGSVTGASGGSAAFIVITADSTPLIFNDGSTPNVIQDKSATIQVLPTGTATDDTHFPLSILRRFGVGFGIANRERTWNTLAVSTLAPDGGVTGNVYYKKDFAANTLHIRGLLTANNAQNFAASPSTGFYLMGVLPPEYIPDNSTYFSAQYFIGGSIKDDLNIGWIRQVNCGINNLGNFYISWVKPDAAVLAYGVNFNTIIPLD